MKIIFRFSWLLYIVVFFIFSACNETRDTLPKSSPPAPTASTPASTAQSTVPSQSALTLQPGTTPGSENEVQKQQLENYIVDALAGNERQHRYVIAVNTQAVRAPLPITKEVIQSCWLYQNNVLQNCLPDDFVRSINSESGGPWNYSYAIFSIIAVNDDYSQATVRLDEISGPGRSQGILYILTRGDKGWESNSRKILWAS